MVFPGKVRACVTMRRKVDNEFIQADHSKRWATPQKNKNYGEVGKTEGKFLNDNPLRGRYSVKFYCE